MLWFIFIPIIMGVEWCMAWELVKFDPPVIGCAIIDGILLLFTGVVASSFFKHKKVAVPLIQAWFMTRVIFSMISSGLIASYLSQPTDTKALLRTVIAAAIWMPYFAMSKRVKNTFIK